MAECCGRCVVVCTEVDGAVGEIVGSLERSGLAEETLVVMTVSADEECTRGQSVPPAAVLICKTAAEQLPKGPRSPGRERARAGRQSSASFTLPS